MDSLKVNIGCGATYHPDWVNLDIAPSGPDVVAFDIGAGLPFAVESVDVCYSSHLLEHLDQIAARRMIDECHRVLRSQGVIRLVVPNLEEIAREYLRILDTLTSGNGGSESNYDWILLELLDQCVRNSSGGEMARYLRNLDPEQRSYVRSRIGMEADNFWQGQQSVTADNGWLVRLQNIRWGKLIRFFRLKLAGLLVYLIAGREALRDFRVGLFRGSGEVHQWMYDRYSIKRLLQQAGFVDIKICTASQSQIKDFARYSLDEVDDRVRKPDSLFIEAIKP